MALISYQVVAQVEYGPEAGLYVAQLTPQVEYGEQPEGFLSYQIIGQIETNYAIPDPPENLQADPWYGGNIITWDESLEAVYYNIYWDTSPGVTKQTGNLIEGIYETIYFHSVPDGPTYYYVATVVGTWEESLESNEDSAQQVPEKFQGHVIW
jgi:hypothetical protein